MKSTKNWINGFSTIQIFKLTIFFIIVYVILNMAFPFNAYLIRLTTNLTPTPPDAGTNLNRLTPNLTPTPPDAGTNLNRLTPNLTPTPTNTGTNASFLEGLRKMGVEPAEMHLFKSPLIITPHVYDVNSNGNVYRQPGTRKNKIISFYHVSQWFKEERSYNRDFKNCPYSQCEVDLTGEKMNEADLVLFDCRRLDFPPGKRTAGQLWALGCWESDANWNYKNYDKWKDAFNVTFSYRLDSDVMSPYRMLAWRDRSQLTLKWEDYMAIAKNKTKTATWWASNCQSNRLNFVKSMQKYVDIDIYGKCGPLKCTSKDEMHCMEKLNTTYKFYLSFDNSHCKHYITEKTIKLFHIESYPHVVPVVKGGFDYDKYFPNMTLVNGNHFRTAKDLALYLKDLGNDVHRYARMLQEKDKLVSPKVSLPDWCDVCKMIHTKKFGIYHDIKKNWSHNTCKNMY